MTDSLPILVMALGLTAVAALLAAGALGAMLGVRWERRGHAAERAAWHEQTARLTGQLDSASSVGSLAQQVTPLREALEALNRQVVAAGHQSVASHTQVAERLALLSRDFATATADVRSEARRLSTALSRSEQRGAWGELQLRRLLEASGMLRHVHFVEQDATVGDAGIQRPDVIVDLGGGRTVVIDAKVPLDAILRTPDASGCDDNADPGDPPAGDGSVGTEHARQVRQHITRLAGKEYWRRYDSPEFVVLFLPSEGLLSTALNAQGDLLQFGLDRKVLLATPTTLLAMLHTVTAAWRQIEAAQQAREVQRLGAELVERLGSMATRMDRLGKSLDRSVAEYNALLATVESRVLVTARRLGDLEVADRELPRLDAVTTEARGRQGSRWPEVAGEPVIDPQLSAPAGRPQPAPRRKPEADDTSAA